MILRNFLSVRRCDETEIVKRVVSFGDVRVRSGKDAEYDSVGDLSSAPHFETDEAREKQKGRKDSILFSCRRAH